MSLASFALPCSIIALSRALARAARSTGFWKKTPPDVL